jgi:hypothetical protein
VLPIIVQALPSSIGNAVERFLPLRIGGVIMPTGTGTSPHAFNVPSSLVSAGR